MSTSTQLGRTYNETHVSRRHTPGNRRFSIYISWSYPGEANRDVTELDNRFSTMVEVRRVGWPAFEAARFADPLLFQRGIAGSLELFFLACVPFQQLVGEVTGHPVAVYQRVDQAGSRLPLDERILADTDTLLVFGLDHMVTEQEAAPEEIAALQQFLKREGTCVILGPHHDVGASPDLEERAMEYAHHGDALVPRQQRFGGYTRALMRGLGVPIENRWGLRPASVPGTNRIAPFSAMRDLDTRGWLSGVTDTAARTVVSSRDAITLTHGAADRFRPDRRVRYPWSRRRKTAITRATACACAGTDAGRARRDYRISAALREGHGADSPPPHVLLRRDIAHGHGERSLGRGGMAPL